MKFKATTASGKNGRLTDVTGPDEVAVTRLCLLREEGQLAFRIQGVGRARAFVRSTLDCKSGPN